MEESKELEVVFKDGKEDIIESIEFYIEQIKNSSSINHFESELSFNKNQTEISFRIKFT